MQRRREHGGTCSKLVMMIQNNQSVCALVAIVVLLFAFGSLFEEEQGAEQMVAQLKNQMGLSNQQFVKLQGEHKTVQQQYAALLKELDGAKSQCNTQLATVQEENTKLKGQVQNENGQIDALKSTIRGELQKLQKHVEA